MIGAELRQQIRLGHRDHSGLDAEEAQHVQVFRGLRHRAFVRRDAEDCDVDSSGSADHRAQESLVPGNVDHSRRADPRKLQVGVSGLQRDPPPLLLRQSIGVDARERPHQRGLAVIDVPSGADHHAQRARHSSTQKTPGASFLRSSVASPRMTATGAAQ